MDAAGSAQYVEFGIGDEKYAVHISEVCEIIRLHTITQVPNCQSYVQGVINLRGEIVPVVNLRTLLAVESAPADKATRIIVVNHDQEQLGFVVDRVNKVSVFSEVQPPSERVGSFSRIRLSGLGMTESGLIGILNLSEMAFPEA